MTDQALGKYARPGGGHLSARAIVCTAHLMRQQNPLATFAGHEDELAFLCLVRDWCEQFEYYWHPGYTPEDVAKTARRMN